MSSSSTIGVHEKLDFSWNTSDHAEKNAECVRVKSPETLTYGGGLGGHIFVADNKTIRLWKGLVRHSAIENFGLMICQGSKE